MTVLLPDWVADNVQREQALEFATDARIKEFNRRLKSIDPHLALAFAPERASGPGIQPGRWHVRRDYQGVKSYLVISTEGLGVPGGYRDPDDGVINSLLKNDTQRAGSKQRLIDATRERETREARERANEREARRDELAINIKALTNPGIRFGGGAWTATAKGRRGRRTTD